MYIYICVCIYTYIYIYICQIEKKKDHIAPGIPLVLFCGPPGTGKTHAMRTLSMVTGLKPFTLDLAGLVDLDSWQAVPMFEEIMTRIQEMENSIIMLDECETAFPCRQKLAGAASVMVQTQKRLLSHFIKWAEGLETSEGLDWEKRRVVLVLAILRLGPARRRPGIEKVSIFN